jgi:hypothetical protein
MGGKTQEGRGSSTVKGKGKAIRHDPRGLPSYEGVFNAGHPDSS